jgi:hypothetical protein
MRNEYRANENFDRKDHLQLDPKRRRVLDQLFLTEQVKLRIGHCQKVANLVAFREVGVLQDIGQPRVRV